MLGDQRLSLALAIDLIRGAVNAHLHPEWLHSSLQSAGGTPMNVPTLRRPSAFIPLGMSGAALAVVLVHRALAGTAPQADEGAAAHIWQLLMAGQVPVIARFATRSLPRAPRRGALILLLQFLACLAAVAPVFFMKL